MGPGLFYGLDSLGHSPPPGQAEQAPSRDTQALADGHEAVRRWRVGGAAQLKTHGSMLTHVHSELFGNWLFIFCNTKKKEYMLLHLILPAFVGKSQAGSSSDLFLPN